MALAIIILWLWSAMLQAASPADAAIFGVFKRADPGLAHFAVLQRTGVTEELDLVVAFGTPKSYPIEPNWTWWDEKRKMGLFLQEKVRPGRIYSLGIKSGFEDCGARVERATATDTVISCRGEKSTKYPTQKWVYDVRAKNVVSQFSYQPFEMHRVFPNGSGVVFVGSDRQQLLAVDYTPGREPEFRVLGAAESAKWFRKVQVSEGTEGIDRKRVLFIQPETFQPLRIGLSGPFRLIDRDGVLAIEEQSGKNVLAYPLPRSSCDVLAAARPREFRNGFSCQGTEFAERIGPWLLEGNQLWFGKTFYDSEGQTGVGGFGYFDTTDRKYHLFAPPEIAPWSVSAIEVAPDAVWMTLVRQGEWGDTSGGLLRYDRQSGTMRRFELPDIGARIIQAGGKILAATGSGIAVVDGDSVKRYFIDRTTGGRLRVAPTTR